MHFRIGDNHGPNGNVPRAGSKQEDQNLLILWTDFLVRHVHVHHHQLFFHQILWNFHHKILHGLFLSIGLTPDFDSLGPYQISVLDLLGA